jgi:undecaprenyl-diphosphatase
VLFLLAFGLWTAAVMRFDLAPIGPQNTSVGFAVLNGYIHALTGVHMALYHVTDWLSLLPLGIAAGFALMGLLQWVRRKRLWSVDRSILALGACYAVMVMAYAGFEAAAVNFRPVLIDGQLETSYPSSTTLLVLCVMPTAALQLRSRVKNITLRAVVCATIYAFTAFMVAGRLLSGVHWLTDILGGILLASGLVMLYDAMK